MFKKMRILQERVEHLENECTHLNFKLDRLIENVNDLAYAVKEMKYSKHLQNSPLKYEKAAHSLREEKSDGNE